MSLLSLARRAFAFGFLLALSWSANAQFVMIWKTDQVTGNPGSSGPNQIMINRSNSGLYNVAFVDVNNSANFGSFSGLNLASHTLTFPSAGTYLVTITGAFTAPSNAGSPDANKLLSIEQWGNVAWTSMSNAFAGCTNLVINASDIPNLSTCITLKQMFEGSSLINGGLENWNVSNIQDFSNMFAGAASFNGDISAWNTANANDLSFMFAGTPFNRDISGWNVSNVTSLYGTFRGTTAFNQNINNWDVSNVTRMSAAFSRTSAFNQPLDQWDMSSVTDIDQMFNEALVFNQDIGGWDVSNANVFADMFADAPAFNQDIGGWNMTNCVYAAGMFQNAVAFDQDISPWDMSNNTALDRMFLGATSFNQNIGSWNVSNVTSMYGVFQDATSFNQDLSGWDVGSSTYMGNMFTGTTAFNSDISGWDVADVNNMTSMFQNASAFNQNLAGWDVGLVSDMSDIFHNSGLSNVNYDNILIGWAALSLLQSDITIGAQTNRYCVGESARASLIAAHGWIFFDGGKYCGPTISSFTPTSAATGATVTITGANFTGATYVSFGDTPAASFIVVNSTTITAVIADGTTGTVAVTTPDGTGTLAGFVYGTSSAPQIIVKDNADNSPGGVVATQPVYLGVTSPNVELTHIFSISNIGDASAEVTSVEVDDPAFTVIEQPTTIAPNSFGRLTLSVTSNNPGLISAQVTVTFTHGVVEFDVQVLVTNAEIEVFNAVTPNGDGAHEFLMISNIERFPDNRVVILDRLGHEVFKMDNYDNANTGKRFEGVGNSGNGKNLTDGTYYYIIDINTGKKYTGFLLLQR